MTSETTMIISLTDKNQGKEEHTIDSVMAGVGGRYDDPGESNKYDWQVKGRGKASDQKEKTGDGKPRPAGQNSGPKKT